jgi:hypothetical protein
MQQAFQSGNILAYTGLASKQKYLDYNDEVLYGNANLRVAAAQNSVPAGQKTIAWITTPFYLDFRRNVIFDVDNSGIGSPWAYIPEEAEYFIVEYEGYGVFPVRKYYEFLQDPGRKQSAEIALNFIKIIQGLSQKGNILYDDGRMVVFKIKKDGYQSILHYGGDGRMGRGAIITEIKIAVEGLSKKITGKYLLADLYKLADDKERTAAVFSGISGIWGCNENSPG